MPDIIDRLKRGHQGSGVGPLDCHDALQEIERLREAMKDSIELLSDTDLGGEDRAGNAMMCLAAALNQQSEGK